MARYYYNYNFLLGYIPPEKIRTKPDDIKSRDNKIDFDCISCGTETIKTFRNIVEKGGPYCGPCTKESKRDKYVNTCLDKYGVDNISQLENIKEKKKETTMENYGVKNPFQSEMIKEKSKETLIQKYGVDHNMKLEITKEKIKQTNIEKYGVPSASQNPEIYERLSIQTWSVTEVHRACLTPM